MIGKGIIVDDLIKHLYWKRYRYWINIDLINTKKALASMKTEYEMCDSNEVPPSYIKPKYMTPAEELNWDKTNLCLIAADSKQHAYDNMCYYCPWSFLTTEADFPEDPKKYTDNSCGCKCLEAGWNFKTAKERIEIIDKWLPLIEGIIELHEETMNGV